MLVINSNNNNQNNVKSGETSLCECSSDPTGIELVRVLGQPESKWILCLITYNAVIIYYLCYWVTSTNSVALSAYVNTVLFNVFSLTVCLICVWVSTKSTEKTEEDGFVEDAEGDRPCETSCFGSEKYEAVALLAFACFILVGEAFVALDAAERVVEQPVVHTGRLGLGALLGLVAHLGTILVYPDAGLNHVVCMALPCSSINTFRECNPILVANVLGAGTLCIAHCVIHIWEVYFFDTAAAFAVIGLTATAMLPLAFQTSCVLLQKVPHHMTEQLNKCLREALDIDGVVEFRNERFWIKSFGKLAGSLQVRIRRNANEAHVLESLMKHFSRIVSRLEIQEFRDTRINSTSVNYHHHHPTEYYIEEILELRAKNRETRDTGNETICDVSVIKIDDIINVQTFAVDDCRNKDVNKCLRSVNNAVVCQGNGVKIVDCLYRSDNLRKQGNAIISGAKFDDFDNNCIKIVER